EEEKAEECGRHCHCFSKTGLRDYVHTTGKRRRIDYRRNPREVKSASNVLPIGNRRYSTARQSRNQTEVTAETRRTRRVQTTENLCVLRASAVKSRATENGLLSHQ